MGKKDSWLAGGFAMETEESGWRAAGRDTYDRIKAEASRYKKQGYLTEIKNDGRFLDNTRAYKLMVKLKVKPEKKRKPHDRDAGLY